MASDGVCPVLCRDHFFHHGDCKMAGDQVRERFEKFCEFLF